MANHYEPNIWELYDPNIPKEEQVHSFITKRKLEKMEEGIKEANRSIEVGDIKMGAEAKVTITDDDVNDARRINITFPPAGKGDPGDNGKSAYQIWLDEGNIGTKQDFLDYLKGIDGKDGKDGIDGEDGAQGPAGESAYQIWLELGYTGSMQDFIRDLKGDKGETGEKGQTGDTGESAYEIWKSQPGNENKSITEFLESLKGEQGPAGSTTFVDFK